MDKGRLGDPCDQRRSRVDVFCGDVPAGVRGFPFSQALVIEVEVERGSQLVSEVHVHPRLIGLQRYLRRNLRGHPITRLLWFGSDACDERYHAAYWRWVHAALVLVVKSFREERPMEWLESVVCEARRGEYAQASASANASAGQPSGRPVK